MRISDWSSDVCSSDLILALQIDFCAAEIGRQPLGEPQRAGTADIMFEQIVEFGLEGGVGLRGAIFAFEGEDQRHQRFGDIAAAEGAEMAARIRLIAQAVRSRGGLGAEAVGTVGHRHAALRKAAILSTSLTPGALSTPVETSTRDRKSTRLNSSH